MKRRKFLKRLGALLGLSAAVPAIAHHEEKPVKPTNKPVEYMPPPKFPDTYKDWRMYHRSLSVAKNADGTLNWSNVTTWKK